MSLDAKWNEGLKADMPEATAAAWILERRLDTVSKCWMECERQPEAAEPIHHLRVASRRAASAVDVFGDLISRRSCRGMQDDLRAIRQAAGAVRDRDVFLEQLDEWAKSRNMQEQPGIDFLAGIWHDVRHRRYQRWRPKLRKQKRFAAIAARIKPRGRRAVTLRERAARVLPQVIDRFSKALSDSEDLHATRIVGKQLRYAVELFACCYPADRLDVPYDMLVELQNALGNTHDAECNARRVQKAMALVDADSRYRPGMESWLAHLQDIEATGPRLLQPWRERWEEVVALLDAPKLKNS